MVFVDDSRALAMNREQEVDLESLLVRLCVNLYGFLGLVVDGGFGEVVSLSHGRYLLLRIGAPYLYYYSITLLG
jgi:hypothetical protein